VCNEAVIVAEALTKDYGDKRAVDDLSFTVRPGLVTGFLGPNGSGKSTTMKMITGLIEMTSGEILFDGSTATMNTRALISATLAGLIRPQVSDVNMVSAPIMVKERGIIVAEVKRDKSGVFDGYIKLTVKTEHRTRSIAGTCFSDGKPRFIQIKGINLDAEVGQHMLYTTNADAPGIIGLLGTVCGENGVNIANFQLGRNRPGGDAIALLYLDAPFPEKVLEQVRAHKSIDSAKRLQFDVGGI